MTIKAVEHGSVRSDLLETLLNLVIETVGPSDVAIGNGGSQEAGGEGSDEWYVMCYWRSFENDGQWEIFITAPSLRAALCRAIEHPRFGQ